MLKSTLIAKCLYQCSMIPDISTGEAAVESIFSEYFPKHNYKNWNTHISDETVKFFLKASSNSSQIRVNLFIEDLWNL